MTLDDDLLSGYTPFTRPDEDPAPMPTPSAYVAGPMTGLPKWNFPAFRSAAAALRSEGWTIISPHELDEAIGFTEDVETLPPDFLSGAMRRDVEALLSVDHVILLPGWETSTGTRFELSVAKMLGLSVLLYDGLRPLSWAEVEAGPETALQEAQRLVHGDRGVDYGHPADDFTRTGRMWGAILGRDDVPPELVGLCMAAVKISREVNHPKRDNRVDLAGYAETVEMVHTRRTA